MSMTAFPWKRPRRALFLALLVAATALATTEGRQAPSPSTPARDTDAARMSWWREARFGMFIHWGLYAIPAGEWKGVTTYGEWIRDSAKIPLAEYEQFQSQFNPTRFDAREWVRMAKDAGVRYIVITSKHHDGFALFDSGLTDWDVMATPFKRDIMKELVDACREAGLRIGWYHSIMDWHHPDYLPRRPWEKRSAQGANYDRFVEYLKGQVKELLTKYGPIDVMWFDGQWESTWTHERGLDMYRYVRSLQPNIIVNNRVDKGGGDYQLTRDATFAGDFGTPEQEVPPMGLPGVDWETCMTMNDNWGYNSHDQNFKSPEQLIRTLVDVASKGGNLLLNVGPTAEGLFPQPSIERLAAIGRWMRVNGESIYGTTASPFPALPWGRATVKRATDGTTRLYLHVFDWPRNGKLSVSGLLSDTRSAFLLADASRKALVTGRDADALTIALPTEAPDAVDSVIALELPAAPDVALAPVITAPTRIFVDGLDVSITTGQQNIELRYTTNGTNPGPTSPLVSGPVRLTSTAMVSARAFRNGRAVSPIARESFSKVLPQKAVALDTTTEPGVRYEYFEGAFEKTTDFKTPVSRGVVKTFDLKPRARATQFGFRYDGYLKVASTGVYQFALTSDDGSRLMIDSAVVVDNDGLHGSREKTGVVALAQGWHRIRVEFFQRDGGLDLKVHWSGPAVPRQPITERDLAFTMGNVRFR
ncbi:MAG: alpha-L-fucosidase [Bacteroidales bacterium]